MDIGGSVDSATHLQFILVYFHLHAPLMDSTASDPTLNGQISNETNKTEWRLNRGNTTVDRWILCSSVSRGEGGGREREEIEAAQ